MHNKQTTAALIATAALLAACSPTEQRSENEINVAEATSNPTEIKVSQLGSRLRYVPLQTTDSSLIAADWRIAVTNSHILIANLTESTDQQTCLSFDINDGSIVARIGHVGQDPQAYSMPVPVVSADGQSAYFALPKNMQQFSLRGEYLGKTFRDNIIGMPGTTVALDTMFLAAKSAITEGGAPLVMISEGFNSPTCTTDTIKPFPEGYTDGKYYDDVSIYRLTGIMPHGNTMFTEYETQNTREYSCTVGLTLWKAGSETHFREAFSDTIFSVTPTSATAAYTFNCGDGRIVPDNVNGNGSIKLSNLFVTETVETPDYIIFAASKGWLRDEASKRFVGYFDKKSATTTATNAADGFVDDLTGFMPFYPIASNSRGDMIGIITVEDIDKWMTDNPGAEMPEALRDLDPEANPIAVILER